MAAAAVGPIQRPQPLGRGPLLQQQFALFIKDQQRERPMQHPAAVMAFELAQVTDLAVSFVHQDQGFGIRR